MKTVVQTFAESDENARIQSAEWEVLYRHAPIGLAVYDRNLRFVRVNDTLAKFHNLSPAEHLGRHVEEVNPVFGKEIAKCLQQVFALGKAILDVEKRWPVQGNAAPEREFLASYYPLRTEGGAISFICSVVQEVSEYRRAEKAARLSETRNRELVEHAVYGIFHAAADGTFLDANPALLSILGCNQLEDLRSLNLVRDIYRSPEHFLQHVADCRSRGLVHGAETEWRRRDGGIITVRLHLRHLSSPG